MSTRILWTRDELILALSLYFQLPFGRLNSTTPEVIELANLIGRSNNSVALRLVNFAACDPYILATGRHGMSGGESICQPIWDEYANDKQKLFFEAEIIKSKLKKEPVEKILGIPDNDLKGGTREVIIKQRVNQNVFRAMILNNYNQTCAITGINDSHLLIASHIIPWSVREDTRLNPENGICLSALYDKAFDQGLITICPDDYTVMVSKELKDRLSSSVYNEHFGKVENRKIILPEEHKPSMSFLQFHATKIYVG